MIFEYCENLLSEIRKRKEKHSNEITSGGITSLEQYKYKIGILKGLEEAEILIQKLNGNLNSLKEAEERMLTDG